MTDRLYYRDSFLYDFDAEVRDVVDSPRPALILDRSAFYPTGGGQIHDTGWLTSGSDKLRITGFLRPDDTVVLFNTGSGLKYLDVLEASTAHGAAGASPASSSSKTPPTRPIGGIIGPY